MEEAQIRQRWQSYFHKLLNEEGDGNIVLGQLGHSESHRDFRYCRRIKVEEVVGAMGKMSRGKATGPDEIPVEFWRYAGRADLEWLTGMFNVIFKTKRMPDEWRWSTMVPVFKNEEDIKNSMPQNLEAIIGRGVAVQEKRLFRREKNVQRLDFKILVNFVNLDFNFQLISLIN
ncbi:PREDICTED: uncharacterized protein LOC109207784 [Nicotiana attenuata]|uniref:uncharacterized protein LOC109207784 n=1 Tax=Nicotiana attenuata TaxID=49451 RepID=UPI0009045D7C|nr:PREDICTED: uncharacterized protein LOC109207784 [Nicotiana attenuata]